jgi:hypothetical protein
VRHYRQLCYVSRPSHRISREEKRCHIKPHERLVRSERNWDLYMSALRYPKCLKLDVWYDHHVWSKYVPQRVLLQYIEQGSSRMDIDLDGTLCVCVPISRVLRVAPNIYLYR